MFCRLYHVSCVVNSSKKQGVKLCKMINPTSKRQWYPSQSNVNMMPSLKSLTKVSHEPGKRGLRRLAMLNKMFMKNITDIMSTGTTSMSIVGRGIEISKVKITPDFHTVNVYWVCKGDSSDEETESALKRIAGVLRHELSTLRVMGEVPYVVFVKDEHEAKLVELDRRLAVADYGEDYSVSNLGDMLKSEFTLDTKLSPELKAKIRKLEENVLETDEPLPEMTHTVYGLDHSKILHRLLAARKKSKDAWENVDSPVISYRSPANPAFESDVGAQRQQLTDFLIKRQIQQNKLRKQLLRSDQWQPEDRVEDEPNDDEDEDIDDEYDGEDYNYYQEPLNLKDRPDI